MEFKDIKNFIAGNYNHLLNEFNLLDDKTKEIANERIQTCKKCSNLVDNKCKLCGCKFPNITFSLDKTCDGNFWKR